MYINSSCITYKGDSKEDISHPKWTTTISDSCMLVPNANDEKDPGIKIRDSSNGRGENDELVLRFSATISLNPEVYKFSNTHAIAIPPSGRYNVTDSYVQVQNMFGERAADCAEGDTSCQNAPVDGTNSSTEANDTTDSSSTTTNDNSSTNSNGGNNG